MRHLTARPAISLLTFTLGVTLASGHLALRRGPHEPRPGRAVEATTAAPPTVDESPAEGGPPAGAVPDTFVRVSGLPEHEAGETEGFRIAFVNAGDGWLANGAKLWRTTDGGAHWELVYSKGKASRIDSEAIDDFRFTNPADGWILANNRLHRTRDGGRTWLPLGLPQVDGYFTSVEFLPGGKVGWVAGSVCGPLWKAEEVPNRFYCSAAVKTASFAAVFMTRDGGRTWLRQPVSRRTGSIEHLRMRGGRSGFAIGQAGAFRYAGGKWLDAEPQIPLGDEAETAYGERCLDIIIGMPTYCPVNFHFAGEKHGWLANSNGYLCRTNDGGRTWVDISRGAEEGQPVDAPEPPFFLHLYVGADGEGIALDTDGGVQETRDGGVTWARSSGRGMFAGMFALDAGRVWLVGAGGVYRSRNMSVSPGAASK